jgi:hypothetical protein
LLDAIQASLGDPISKFGPKFFGNISAENVKNAHFLIATVPDPMHTHLSLLFDRQIAAIEEAVQQGGYLFSRAYLPWDNEPHQDDTDYRIRLGQQDYQDAREDYPGLLLFHNAENSERKYRGQRPYFVFLVAETPTGGINKQQFINAVDAIEKLCPKNGCDDPPQKGSGERLSILGPTFSGSFYSLHALLAEMQRQKRPFSEIQIRSGTATGGDTIDWFVNALKDFSNGNSAKSGLPQYAATFQTFQLNNTTALDFLLSFACSQDYVPERVAVLSEDETAYGNPPQFKVKESSSDRGSHSTIEQACSEPEESKLSEVLRLNFPRDISALRNAYQRDSQASASSGSSSIPPRSNLRLNLEDNGNDDDSVASFSPGQTPISEEAVMSGIVSHLREDKINLVVVEATNPLDSLFLLRYLRGAYPEARIVTVNTDLMLPSQANDSHLRGVMQIDSYPLIPGVKDRTSEMCPDDRFGEVFPSDYSAGTFHAALSLLESQHSALNRCTPSEDMYKIPYTADRLWLTALGSDQFWPVELYGTDPKEYPATNQPTPWIILGASAFGLACIYAFLCLKGNVISSSIFLANFAPVNDPWRNRTLLFCGVIIFDVFICLLWPRFWLSGHERCLVIELPIVVAALVFLDLYRRSGRRLASDVVALGLLCFGGSFVILWFAFSEPNEHLQHFLRYRYEHAASGVSPVVPFFLLFAGFLWVAWQSLTGRPPWDCRGSGPPLPSKNMVIKRHEDAHRRLLALTRYGNGDLVSLMKPGSLHWRLVTLTLVTLGVPTLALLVLASPRTIQSFESYAYNVIYTGLLIFAVGLILWNTFRLVFIWMELRRFLMALDRLPIRRAFVRMAGFKSRRLWQLGGNTFEDFFAVLSMEIQTTSALLNSRSNQDKLWSSLRQVPDSVLAFGRWMRIEQESGRSKGVDFTHKLVKKLQGLQIVLARACAKTLLYLEGEWNQETRPVWDAERMSREKTPWDDLGLRQSVQLAEDFVCLFYFNFISSVFTRMRSLVLSVAGLYVFVLLSFSSYPFEPSSTFHTAMIFLLIFITAAVAIVSGQAHKDATISRITSTEPGELGLDFWFRLAATMSIPLLSLLAAKFPEIGGFLFSWLQPASQAFK